MSLKLHTVKSKTGARRTSKRVGRGLGSKGTYSGRGVKGQRARSGGRAGLQLKGIRRIMLAQKKLRGFKSPHEKPATITLADLSHAFQDGAKVTPDILIAKGIVKTSRAGVKILGTGSIAIKLTVTGCRATAGAKAKIEKAGGSVA